MRNILPPWLSSGLLLLLLPGLGSADPPRINTIYPPAVQRGVETRLQFTGTGLGTAMELVVPLAAEATGAVASGGSTSTTPLPSFVSDAAVLAFKPAPDTTPGVYPVRVRTPEG